MKTAYIIYYDKEAQKNSGFIEMLMTEFFKYDIVLEYVSYEVTAAMSGDVFKNSFNDAVFVINRTREYRLSKRFEDIDIKLFHSSKITELGNNKYKTYCYLKDYFKRKGFEPENQKEWIADTVFVKADELKQTIDKYNGNDYVIKSVDGHGGSEVFLLESCVYEKLKGHDCILQKRIDSDSNDIRVYILFGEIYAAVLRHGTDGFKSNFSLGGSVSEYFPDEKQRNFIGNFIEAFGKDELKMAGIDFILTKDGRLVFNELEEMVGSRMLYNCSKHDIVKEYVELVQRKLNL